MQSLEFKRSEIKVRKIKSYAITRRGSIHRQIKQRPDLNKSAESKCPNYLLQGFGAIT